MDVGIDDIIDTTKGSTNSRNSSSTTNTSGRTTTRGGVTVSGLEKFLLQKNSTSSINSRITSSTSSTSNNCTTSRIEQLLGDSRDIRSTNIRQSSIEQQSFQNLRLLSSSQSTSSGPPRIKQQGGFSMDSSDLFSNSENLVDIMRKKMEAMEGFGGTNAQFMNTSSVNNGILEQNSISSSSLSSNQQVQMATSNVSTIEAKTSSINSEGGGLPLWIEEKLRKEGILKENQRITAATAQKTSIRASSTTSTTASSSSTSGGVTRSFSSNSGFPLLSSLSETNVSTVNGSNNLEMHAAMMSSSKDNSKSTGAGALDLSSIPSPFRRAPFTFRNFDGPLWTDNITPMGMIINHPEPNRKTWDLSTAFKSKGNKVHFSASQSQHAVFESTNGGSGFRAAAYQDQRVILRQSYGASESEDESEDDEDSDFLSSLFKAKNQKKFIGFASQVQPNAKAMAIPFKPKLAIQDKPNYAPSEDDTSSVCQSEPERISTLETEPINEKFIEHESPKTPEHKKCFKVAQELLTTERSYVNILHLIDQIFHFRVDQENRAQQMFPPEIITHIFCNVKSLYQFHHDHLLPRLEARLERWEDDPRIGDIMKESAPFLKMYSEYVQNFDNSINLINAYKDKNPRFANIINEIQSMEECLNLPIQHHLIGPIQRIPRYRLLLEAYLKRLSEDSNDKKDTEEALHIVSKAAEHANEAMRRIVSFKKLLEAQEQIRGVMDLVSPTRMLIKEGKLFKISARSSEHQERYLFLFSDMVLLCSIRSNYLRSAPQYQLRAKLEVAEMTISEGDDLEVLNTFYIQDENKRIELYTEREDEKRSWMEAMYQARVDLMQRKSSLRLGSVSPSEDDLGIKEPAKIKYDGVSKCMECDVTFSMLKRKHHCHACGIVICAKCSTAKFSMHYANGKLKKVCGTCKIILQGKEAEKRRSANGSPSSTDEEKIQGVLDVPAEVPAVLSSYLNLRLRGKKEWTTRWFALRSDFVLYCYAKDSDDRAMTATPIPGMTVQMADELTKNEALGLPITEKDRTFRLAHSHGRKYFFLCAPTKEEALVWVEKLGLASTAADLNNPQNNGEEPTESEDSNPSIVLKNQQST